MEKHKFSDIIKNITVEEIAVSLLSAFLIASTFVYVTNDVGPDDINFIAGIDGTGYLAVLLSAWAVILVIKAVLNKKQVIYCFMLISSMIFAYTSVIEYGNIYLLCGILLILGYFNYYLLKDDKLGFEALVNKVKAYDVVYMAVGMGIVFFTCVYAFIGICRYRVYDTACFDFGVFSQMYEYMAETGMPLTTCERGYLLSHFYIHFSPVYYVFLPVYMLFRTPESLLVIQATMVFASAIPLLMLLKIKGFKPIIAIIICYIYILSPAITQPVLFDFHENKFIPFFMLWFIYFYETKKYKLMYPALLLTLMIKEDTAIYLIVLTLYFIISGNNRKHGIIAFLCSVIYFVAVMTFIQYHGMGLMEEHYGLYYLKGQRGVLPMIQNILYVPGFFLKNVFSEGNFEYIVYTLGSLLFVPIINKDMKRLLLLLPFVVFCLMTDYAAQHDVGYQYTYGPMMLMFYLFILNINSLPEVFKKLVCITSLFAVVIMSMNYNPDIYSHYTKSYLSDAAKYDEMDATLREVIDENASVTASAYVLPHLTYHNELYMYDDEEFRPTDYYVLSTKTGYYIDHFSERSIYKNYYKCCEVGEIAIYKLK